MKNQNIDDERRQDYRSATKTQIAFGQLSILVGQTSTLYVDFQRLDRT